MSDNSYNFNKNSTLYDNSSLSESNIIKLHDDKSFLNKRDDDRQLAQEIRGKVYELRNQLDHGKSN